MTSLEHSKIKFYKAFARYLNRHSLLSVLCISLIWITSSCSEKQKEKQNEIPESEMGNQSTTAPETVPSDLLPVNYRIHDEITGDVNKDGIPDKILVMVHNSEPKEAGAINPDNIPARKLLILLAKSGQFQKVMETDSAIMCRDCGGMMGDPYQSIKIERNSFLISHFGGSREKWGYDHRFQLRTGKWQMTGITETEYDSLTGQEIKIDTNLLTGDSIITKTDKNNKKNLQRKKSKPSNKYLRDFKV